MISQLDKLIKELKEIRSDLYNFNWSDKDYIQGKKNGILVAINKLEEFKEGLTNE